MKSRILFSMLALTAAELLAFTGCFDFGILEDDFEYTTPTEAHTEEKTDLPTSEATDEPVTTTTAATVQITEAATETTTDETDLIEVVTDETDLTEEPDNIIGDSEPPGYIEGITNETFLKYISICDKYKPGEGNNAEYIYLYNFNASMSTGFGTDGTVVHGESDYGVQGTVEDRLMYITVYDHTGTKRLTAVYLQGLDASNVHENAIIQITTESTFKFDSSTLRNGLYRIIAKFSNGATAPLHFYINGEETWFCEQNSLTERTEKNYENRRADLMRILKEGNVTPENSLSLEDIWYPFPESDNGYRCDTQRWSELSDTIINNESWSDEYKLYRLQAWIRENIAYDEFSQEQGKLRAEYYEDFSGKYSAYNLRAGVGFDYANIVAIMCRTHGIPAVTISSETSGHEWNAVYVNNRWMEFDACMSAQYRVGEDTSVRERAGNGSYDGIFSVMIWGNAYAIPSDAAANQDV